MKSGIITHYDVHNHGAQLQLYALSSQLNKLGFDAKALRYTKNYDFIGHELEAKYSISIRSIPVYIKYLFQFGLRRTLYNIKKKKTLNNFRLKHGLVGEYYSEAENLDIVVIGSDEIFSIESGLNPCFWGMGVPCDKVISYAASFGPTNLEFIKEHNAEEFIKAGIERIDFISVRDENSKKIIQNYSAKNMSLVCDPVLMYDFENDIKTNKINTKNKYCVVYAYDNNMNDDETVNAIKTFAENRGIKIYSVGYYHKWCDRNIDTDPLDVFGWFANAEIVFTDTFHGSVISLVTNSQFFVKIGENKNKLEFLLKQYRVADRQVNSFSEIENYDGKPIDYEIVNKTISEIKKFSLKYLKEALEKELC